MRRFVPLLALCSLAALPLSAQRRVDNVIVVTIDGLRWQEVFGGAERSLINDSTGGVADTASLLARFWRPAAEARRAALMPFVWGAVAAQGQIFGDSTRGSVARITNGLWFSYPGYNELLAGWGDPRVDSNDKVPNPNVTVLEFLNARPPFRGRVAAFGSWDVLPFILNTARSGLPANGAGAPFATPRTDRQRLINEMTEDAALVFGAGARLDVGTMAGALEVLRTERPRVLYVMLGETDEWAHHRRYDQYLDAAWRADRFIRRLWETAQGLSQYRGRTALVLATDHGRGDGPRDWTDHGRRVPAAERIWMAVLGPDTPALGVRRNVAVTQSQFAATIAALLGEDFVAAQPRAAPPLPGVVR